jgi:large subunit ribosomal protein L4
MMEIKLKIKSLSLENKPGKDLTLNEKIFGLLPREDIITRVVRWQLSKRRLGNHSVKTRSDIKMTTAKMYKQKGTGKARHG